MESMEATEVELRAQRLRSIFRTARGKRRRCKGAPTTRWEGTGGASAWHGECLVAFFPEVFVAIVVEADAADLAVRFALKGKAGGGAGGVEEGGGAFGEEFGDVADAIALEELVALAIDGNLHDTKLLVLAFVGLIDRRADLGGHGVDRDDEAFRCRSNGLVEVMGEEPVGELWLGVGLVPDIVADVLVLPQADVGACGFEGVEHEGGLFDENDVVVDAVEEPGGGMGEGVGVLGGELGLLPALWLVGPEDAAADGNDGGEDVGPIAGDLPDAVTAERQAGEVSARGIGVELAGLGGEGVHGHGHHVRIGPAMAVEGDLGHDDDGGPAFGVDTNGGGQADLGLVHALGAALARAVEEENDGQVLVLIPAQRQVDLVAVGDAVEHDGAIEKARSPGGAARKRRAGRGEAAPQAGLAAERKA